MSSVAIQLNRPALKNVNRKSPLPALPARVSGFLYLALFVLAMFAPMAVEKMVVEGDAAATAEKISGSMGVFGGSLVAWIAIVAVDTTIAALLYVLLERVNRPMAMTLAAFRLLYSAAMAVFLLDLFDVFALLNGAGQFAGMDAQQVSAAALVHLERFDSGFAIALAFFGLHLALLGVLLLRSSLAPRALALLLTVAGVSYVLDTMAKFFLPGYTDTASVLMLTPAMIGELWLAFWLLSKGFRGSRAVEGTAS